jgi:hypothetical protein
MSVIALYNYDAFCNRGLGNPPIPPPKITAEVAMNCFYSFANEYVLDF